jgi:hypothetical protein
MNMLPMLWDWTGRYWNSFAVTCWTAECYVQTACVQRARIERQICNFSFMYSELVLPPSPASTPYLLQLRRSPLVESYVRLFA